MEFQFDVNALPGRSSRKRKLLPFEVEPKWEPLKFDEEPVTIHVELDMGLWEKSAGLKTECDFCGNVSYVVFSHLQGAPSQSRFAQWEVMCVLCRAHRSRSSKRANTVQLKSGQVLQLRHAPRLKDEAGKRAAPPMTPADRPSHWTFPRAGEKVAEGVSKVSDIDLFTYEVWKLNRDRAEEAMAAIERRVQAQAAMQP